MTQSQHQRTWHDYRRLRSQMISSLWAERKELKTQTQNSGVGHSAAMSSTGSALGSTKPPLHCVLSVKAYYTPPCSAEAKYQWGYTFTPYAFMVCTGTTLLWSSSVFYQVFIAEDVDGVAEIPPWLTYRHFWGPFWTCHWCLHVSVIKLFFLVKSKTSSLWIALLKCQVIKWRNKQVSLYVWYGSEEWGNGTLW